MSASAKIVCLSLCWAAGILAGVSFEFVFLFVFIIIFVCFKCRSAKVILIFFAVFLCGFLRIYFSSNNPVNLAEISGKNKVAVIGFIYDEIDTRDEYIFLPVHVQKITYLNSSYNFDFKMIVKTNLYQTFEYGDYIEAKGVLAEPDGAGNFSYKNYLSVKGIEYLMYYPEINKFENSSKNIFSDFIIKSRQKIIDVIENISSEPYSSFISALLIGARKGIPENITEDFKKIGLTHILAVSGYNITLVIAFVFALLGNLRRRMRIVFALIFIFFFVFLAGASPSVVRASIMGAIGLAALAAGRKNFPEIALAVSFFLITLWNPKSLIFDAGFQLSFLSTGGMIYLMPVVARFFEKVPNLIFIRDIFLATICAQFFTLPILLGSFGRISLIAPIANIFILPLIPIIMLFSFIAILAGAFFIPAGVLIAVIPISISKFIFFISEILAKSDFSYVEINSTPKIIFFILYFAIVYIILKREISNQTT